VRIRKVGSEREMELVVDEMITLGYDVKDRGVRTALLKKKTWGDVVVIIVLSVIAFVLAIFTLGISFLLPIAYIVFKHQTADTIKIKVDPSTDVIGYPIQPQIDILPSTTQASSNFTPSASSSVTPDYVPLSDMLSSSRKKNTRLSLSSFNQVDLLIILVSLFWGMIAGVLVALPLEVVLNVPDGVAAFIEEPAKLLPVIAIAIWYPYLLYSKKKCAVFGAIAGLGFGAVENMWYFLLVPKQFFVEVVVGRTVFLPGHLIYSAIAAMSLMYIASRRQRYYAVLLFSLAILLHFVWNSVIPAYGIYVILSALEIVLFILVYRTVPDQVVDPNAIPTTLDELFHRDFVSES
jgi:hypothetical protein